MERAVYFSVSKSQLFSLWECEEGPSCVQSVNETKHLGVFMINAFIKTEKNSRGRGVVSVAGVWSLACCSGGAVPGRQRGQVIMMELMCTF